MIENIEAIEKALHLKSGALKEAIESTDAVAVELPELEIFKKEDYTARIENLKTTFQKQGQDFLVAEAKEKFGLTFEGKKIDKLVEELQKKTLAEAKIEPEAKVKTLTEDLEKLRGNLAEKDAQISQIENTYKGREKQRTINDLILSKIGDTAIPKEDVLVIFKSKYEVDIEDNKPVFKQNGEVLKHASNLNPLTADEVLASFLPTYAKPVQGGAGAGDSAGNHKAGSIDAFIKEMKDAGINAGSEKFNAEMQKRIADKTLKV